MDLRELECDFEASVDNSKETVDCALLSEIEVNETTSLNANFKNMMRIQDYDCGTDSNEELLPYHLFYSVTPEESCKSFDIIPDELGDDRSDKYPLTMTIVGGTQFDEPLFSSILVMKISDLESIERLQSEEISSDAKLHSVAIHHSGNVDKIKVTNVNGKVLAATWSDSDALFFWDLTLPLEAVNNPDVLSTYVERYESPLPLCHFKNTCGGYALQWSPEVPGLLAAGDAKRRIQLYWQQEGGSWHVDSNPYTAHAAAIDDIQWSPTEKNVMASCSADKSIMIWDIRIPNNDACVKRCVYAHDDAVTSISWNNRKPYILSGGCDEIVKVWDIRNFAMGSMYDFKFHEGAITSVEWNPAFHSVFTSAGTDDRLAQWDLLSQGDGVREQDEDILALPKELLYIHVIKPELKEVQWHKQMPEIVVSTCERGFRIIQSRSMKHLKDKSA